MPYTFTVGNKAGVPPGFTVPCGTCAACRVNYARFWMVRCYFEFLDYESTLFVTLTYDPAFIPEDGKLSTRDLQLFWKRFRKAIAPRKIRYFCAGEYGPKNMRPHYHAIVFGGYNEDLEIIRKAWGKGFVQISPKINFGGIIYCCKYSLKSRRSDNFEYPSKLFCSRRPGIGHSAIPYFKKLYDEGRDFHTIKIEGKEFAIPSYYLKNFIDEEAKHKYMYKNSIFFQFYKKQYFELVRGKLDSIEARDKIFNVGADL